MMRKEFSFVIIFLFMTFFSIGSAFAEKSKVIELSFAHTIPPVVPIAKIYQQWANKIEEQTGGRVKINYYWSGSLLKASEFFRGVLTGQSDISYYVVGLDYGLMPLNMFTKLGFLGYPSKEVGTKIYHEIYDKFPEIRAEFKGLKVLSARMGPAYQLHFIKKEVRTPGDLKGMKMISVGGSMAKEMAAMGAAPMDVKVGDLYMSLERGMAEGISCHVPILQAFGILNLLPYHLLFKGGTSMGPDMNLINLNTWNSLPPDIQQIFESLGPWMGEELIKSDNGYEAMIIGEIKKMGHTLISPSSEEMKLWEEAVRPIHEKWITDNEGKGLPARAIYEEAKRLIKKYRK